MEVSSSSAEEFFGGRVCLFVRVIESKERRRASVEREERGTRTRHSENWNSKETSIAGEMDGFCVCDVD